jgi:hypothetical protein
VELYLTITSTQLAHGEHSDPWAGCAVSSTLREVFPGGPRSGSFRLLSSLIDVFSKEGEFSLPRSLVLGYDFSASQNASDGPHPLEALYSRALELGLLCEGSDERVVLSGRAALLADEISAFSARAERDRFLQRITSRRSFYWKHETEARDSFVALSGDVFTDSWEATGEALARSVLQGGGRIVLFQIQPEPLQGPIQSIDSHGKLNRRIEALVQEFGPERCVRLSLGRRSTEYCSENSSAWIRDQIGIFCDSQSTSEGQEVLYLASLQDRLKGQPPFDRETSVRDPRNIKRLSSIIKAVGGFFYPLGSDAVAVSAAVFDRHQKESAATDIGLTHTEIKKEFEALGRPNVVVIPYMSPSVPHRLMCEEEQFAWRRITYARHADTTISQVGETVFIPDVSSRVKRELADPALLDDFLEKQRRLEEVLRAGGFTVEFLPRFDAAHGLDFGGAPCHTINFLQYFDAQGDRHLVVPGVKDMTAAEEDIRREIESKLVRAGAASVTFIPFGGWGGGFRCLTQHVPGRAVTLLGMTHAIDAVHRTDRGYL